MLFWFHRICTIIVLLFSKNHKKNPSHPFHLFILAIYFKYDAVRGRSFSPGVWHVSLCSSIILVFIHRLLFIDLFSAVSLFVSQERGSSSRRNGSLWRVGGGGHAQGMLIPKKREESSKEENTHTHTRTREGKQTKWRSNTARWLSQVTAHFV